MSEDDKRILTNRLEERTTDVQKLTNTQLDLLNQLMIANQELNRKDIEIATLTSHNEQLRSELRTEKITQRENEQA